MNLAELLSGASEERRPPNKMPIPEAQIDNMRLLLGRLLSPPNLNVGDIVTCHRQLDSRSEPWARQPMMVVKVSQPGTVLPGYALDRSMMGTLSMTPDVEVLCYEPHGGISFRIFDRRVLALWDEEKQGAAEE